VRGGRLSREALAAIERWAASERVECLYFLADAGDPRTARLAEESGFRLVDVRVTLERRGGAGVLAAAAAVEAAGAEAAGARAGPPAEPAGARAGPPEAAAGVRVRQAAAADLPELRRIAAASHHDSRFYHDPHFDRGRCDELYATWIEKSCADPSGIVLVAEAAAAPGGAQGAAAAGAALAAGYITATLAPGGEGRIGLFAVGPEGQGRGVGGELIAAALAWFAGRGAEPVSVVTQGRNVRAQRIYQKAGFLTRAVELWFHRWWEAAAFPDHAAETPGWGRGDP
jgi:dTDP-4-amino-4,6-dideoxy-D-galactose acyltransferase